MNQNPSNKVVSVAFPVGIQGLYDYLIPDEFAGLIVPGTPLLVQLRSNSTWGVAVALKERSAFMHLKPVLDIKRSDLSNASQSLIKLYEWIADYYQCELGRVFRPLVRKRLMAVNEKTTAVYTFTPLLIMPVLTPLQQRAAEALQQCGEPLPAVVLGSRYGITPAVIAALCKKGLLQKALVRTLREGIEMQGVADAAEEIILTLEQCRAVATLGEYLGKPDKPFLLHGITGSGKTHIYIELVRRTLDSGKGAIVLVPEIALTPQTIARFRAALGDVFCVIHSRMSDGERRDTLDQIVTGAKRVIVGVRSAILAPLSNVGLIIVDEEHDGSYKQSECAPRFSARDVAVVRGSLCKALVVLGSATPSLETYYNALSGKYHLLELKQRFGGATLPTVEIVDMKAEHESNNWTMLSQVLRAAIGQTMLDNRQIILLFNRRGFSTVLICKSCGHVHICPHCSVNLIYHKSELSLKCHQCGYYRDVPTLCPKCKGVQLKYQGSGIQKAEETLTAEFVQARIIRMDQDTTRHKGAHHDLLGRFGRGEADILLGTQMVAKGLNFKGVALVGVIAADIGLHFPDFRASERTFQLLTQVAGRAGRGDDQGTVIIQTYFPEDPAIRCAQQHDYDTFYQAEIGQRKALMYPPFGKLARIVVQAQNEESVRSTIGALVQKLKLYEKRGLVILGPAPAFIARIKNMHRYNVLLKAPSSSIIQAALKSIKETINRIPKKISVAVDVDPVNML